MANETFLEFFAKCFDMGELYKFDKLCPDLDISDCDVKRELRNHFGRKIGVMGHMYYDIIFDKFKDKLKDCYNVPDEVLDNIYMSFCPVEFYYVHEDESCEYFTTIDELKKIIKIE